MIEAQIRELAENWQGATIPKPGAKAAFRIKGLGIRRGETALIYTISSYTGSKPYQKGITIAEFRKAYSNLKKREFNGPWFNQELPGCAKEGSCNFTSLGGILELLGVAKYSGRGVYKFEAPS